MLISSQVDIKKIKIIIIRYCNNERCNGKVKKVIKPSFLTKLLELFFLLDINFVKFIVI